MELLFLGTGAADYSPRLKGDLAGRYDRDIRRSSALLLDDGLLIDCGDWILEELAIAGVPAADIRRVMVTHSHADHFRADHLCALAAAAGHPIEVYAGEETLRLLAQRSAGREGAQLLYPRLLVPFRQDEVGPWRVTPLFSNHQTEQPQERTLHLLLEKDAKQLMYGTDGAWLPTATGKYLFGREVDAWLFDATCGETVDEYRIFEHNTLPMIRLMLPVLRSQRMIADNAQLVLTHLAPSLHAGHAKTQELVEKDGLLVAYDGMRLHV